MPFSKIPTSRLGKGEGRGVVLDLVEGRARRDLERGLTYTAAVAPRLSSRDYDELSSRENLVEPSLRTIVETISFEKRLQILLSPAARSASARVISLGRVIFFYSLRNARLRDEGRRATRRLFTFTEMTKIVNQSRCERFHRSTVLYSKSNNYNDDRQKFRKLSFILTAFPRDSPLNYLLKETWKRISLSTRRRTALSRHILGARRLSGKKEARSNKYTPAKLSRGSQGTRDSPSCAESS